MDKLEKVIKGLEYCAASCKGAWEDNNGCPYMSEFCKKCLNDNEYNGRCIDLLCADALALLKAQEPRVMTAGDMVTLEKGDVIVLEQHEIGVIINAIYMQRITREDDDTTYTEAIKVVTAYTDGSTWLNCGTYGKVWRIWTSRPTDAQREAVPWSD